MAEAEAEFKFCSNCKRDIAAGNFVMHEVHCRRNIVLCPDCHEPVPRADLESHRIEEHTPVPCDLCQGEFQKDDLQKHKEDECPRKPQICIYCELEFPRCELSDHLDYCGSRTEQCFKCRAFVMHKDQQKHDESNCKYPEVSANNAKPNNLLNKAPRRNVQSSHRPFVLNELDRMTNELPRSVQRTANQRSLLSKKSNDHTRSTRLPPRSRRDLNTLTGEKSPVSKPSFQQAAAKNNYVSRNMHSTQHSASSAEESGGQQEQLDRLLALHLEQDLFSAGAADSDLEMHRDLGLEELASIPDIPVPPSHVPFNDFDAVPCEFCHHIFPAEILIEHQASCSGDESGISPGVLEDTRMNNKRSRRRHQQSPANLPSFLDNLETTNRRSADESGPAGLSEDVMLPCEFCDELLPEDIIIQHQAVCDAASQPSSGVSNEVNRHTDTGLRGRNRPSHFSADLASYDTVDHTESRASNNTGRTKPKETGGTGSYRPVARSRNLTHSASEPSWFMNDGRTERAEPASIVRARSQKDVKSEKNLQLQGTGHAADRGKMNQFSRYGKPSSEQPHLGSYQPSFAQRSRANPRRPRNVALPSEGQESTVRSERSNVRTGGNVSHSRPDPTSRTADPHPR